MTGEAGEARRGRLQASKADFAATSRLRGRNSATQGAPAYSARSPAHCCAGHRPARPAGRQDRRRLRGRGDRARDATTCWRTSTQQGLRVLLPGLAAGGPTWTGPRTPARRISTAPRPGCSSRPVRPLGATPIASADVIIVPALAVDRTGIRLGRGAGAYDAALSRLGPGCRDLRAALPRRAPDELPAEPHDRAVSAVAMPAGVVELARRDLADRPVTAFAKADLEPQMAACWTAAWQSHRVECQRSLGSSWRSSLPTYAYRCADCGHRFETVQSFTDDALTVCPVCNGVLRKVFNAVGVVFKGSGFYRTDSRAAALASNGNGERRPRPRPRGPATKGSERDLRSGRHERTASSVDQRVRPRTGRVRSSDSSRSKAGRRDPQADPAPAVIARRPQPAPSAGSASTAFDSSSSRVQLAALASPRARLASPAALGGAAATEAPTRRPGAATAARRPAGIVACSPPCLLRLSAAFALTALARPLPTTVPMLVARTRWRRDACRSPDQLTVRQVAGGARPPGALTGAEQVAGRPLLVARASRQSHRR